MKPKPRKRWSKRHWLDRDTGDYAWVDPYMDFDTWKNIKFRHDGPNVIADNEEQYWIVKPVKPLGRGNFKPRHGFVSITIHDDGTIWRERFVSFENDPPQDDAYKASAWDLGWQYPHDVLFKSIDSSRFLRRQAIIKRLVR